MQEGKSEQATAKVDRALAALDRVFTLFFLVTLVIVIPTVTSLLNTSVGSLIKEVHSEVSCGPQLSLLY
jgi:hypothetical protein